jgi:glycerophosphoryl diester phosphodiesterase
MPRTTILAGLSLLALTACSEETPPNAGNSPVDAWLQGVDLAAYMDCARERGVTLLQAHRAGDRAGAAENSISAIEASLADGAVFMEIDVAQTSDGVLVLMHDRTLDRTTTGSGSVSDTPYTEFQSLQLVDLDGAVLEESPPTLAEVLDMLDGRGIAQIDRKEDVSFDQIAAALEAADAVDRSVVITYTLADAIALHERLPSVIISAGVNSLEDLATLDAAGFDRTRLSAWLGLGTGNPELDAALARQEIETSFGDFRAERDGTIDYTVMAANGAEVISVDDVPAASQALASFDAARALLTACGAAQP